MIEPPARGRKDAGAAPGEPYQKARAGPPDAAVGAAGATLAAYLAATAVPLALGGLGGPRGAVFVAHLAVLGAVVALEARRGGRGRGAVERFLADWHLLLLLPALYAELPLLMEAFSGGYHDATIMAVEDAVFGAQPAYDWAGAWPFRWLSESLHGAYLAYYPIIYLPPFLLYARGAHEAHRETMAGLGLSMLACYLVFVVWPVQGPRYLGAPEGVPEGPVRSLVLALLRAGSSRGAAFPSSHVSVAVTQTLLALRLQPRAGAVLAVVTPLLAAGAVYGGFHYATDALVGAAVGVVAALAAGPLQRWITRRIRGAPRGFTSRDDGA